jgi:hypothetical protein
VPRLTGETGGSENSRVLTRQNSDSFYYYRSILLTQARGNFVIYSVELKRQVPGVHRFQWEFSQPVELKAREFWYRLGCEATNETCVQYDLMITVLMKCPVVKIISVKTLEV